MQSIPQTPRIRSIAIIWAGPSGLAAAKYLLAEKAFDKVRIFERRQTTGGMWNYTKPKPYTVESSVAPNDSNDYITPVYDELESNIPKTLMQYSDHPFPAGTQPLPALDTVLEYLQRYGTELLPLIAFETAVQKVQQLPNRQWALDLKYLTTNNIAREVFDAILVASSHFDKPKMPRIAGLVDWQRTYPGTVSHSLTYRNASAYNGQKVVVVGHNASGAEISTQIARTAKQPVLVSVKQLPQQAALVSSGTEFVPDIVELLPDDRCIRFADGRLEHHMDRLVFCTGYYSTFPFLDRLGPCYNGYCTQKLYQHIFYIPEPSIAFAAMPLKSTPFPLAESQAAVIARVWSGRLKLPSQDNMLQWDANLLKMHGDRKMTPHEAANFNASLMNTLYDWSLQAERRSGLDKDGNGKLPTRWNEKDVWLRSQLGPIKVAFSAKGSERHNITTPKELGFDFQQDPAS